MIIVQFVTTQLAGLSKYFATLVTFFMSFLSWVSVFDEIINEIKLPLHCQKSDPTFSDPVDRPGRRTGQSRSKQIR